MSEFPRVLVASPVRQKPAVLSAFLKSLEELDTSGLEVHFAFIDDNDDDGARRLLGLFAAKKRALLIPAGSPPPPYVRDEATHRWREELIWRVAAFKNRLLEIAREGNYDYLFLVDSDLVLHPKTLVHLVSLNKDIVAEVFWTSWEPSSQPLPQVWLGDQYRLFPLQRGEAIDEREAARRQQEFLEMLRRPGTYRVGGLGACTLISRRAICRGVSFAEIYNLSLVGEDRHFCVRAAALGLELYADTCYPPYHLYREADLAQLEKYRQKTKGRGSTITLAMLVRNEAERYLKVVLRHAARYIDRAVILDDASEDGTPEICREALRGISLTLVSNREPSFHHEAALRRQLWELALSTSPDWILILDADEIFEERAVSELRRLAADPDVEVYYFRLFDLWDESHYREDAWWRAHLFYRPFMVRHVPGFPYRWLETPLHCGRFPCNITELRGTTSNLRVKHLGWMKPEDRLAKYYRYKKLDPQARYGIREQYLSILDPRPRLVPWREEEL